MCGLTKLIQAACYSIKNDVSGSVELLRDVIEERKDIPYNSNDAHISAFACYELGVLLIKEPEVKIHKNIPGFESIFFLFQCRFEALKIYHIRNL